MTAKPPDDRAAAKLAFLPTFQAPGFRFGEMVSEPGAA